MNTTTAPPAIRDHVTLTPVNVASGGGVSCTINTRYDDMSMADIISLRHYPKTVILYEYETI